jgi:hypothetical protein
MVGFGCKVFKLSDQFTYIRAKKRFFKDKNHMTFGEKYDIIDMLQFHRWFDSPNLL